MEATFAEQLAKVNEALRRDPGNESLRTIAERLQKAIELCTPQKKPRSLIDDLYNNSNSGAEEYRVGDRVEARSQEDGAWKRARVLAVIGSHVTVQFAEGVRRAQHCRASDIRPLRTTPSVQERGRSLDILNAPVVPDHVIKRPRVVSSATKEAARPTKAAYIAKKEEEHRTKQESWKRFSQTLRK